jgi:hypothetical protein
VAAISGIGDDTLEAVAEKRGVMGEELAPA